MEGSEGCSAKRVSFYTLSEPETKWYQSKWMLEARPEGMSHGTAGDGMRAVWTIGETP